MKTRYRRVVPDTDECVIVIDGEMLPSGRSLTQV